jgi:hypothetical protein
LPAYQDFPLLYLSSALVQADGDDEMTVGED